MTPTEEMAEAMLTKLGWKPKEKGFRIFRF